MVVVVWQSSANGWSGGDDPGVVWQHKEWHGRVSEVVWEV